MAVTPFSWQALPALPVRSVRFVVGAWALVWDEVAAAVRSPGDLLERLELRGVRLNRQFRRTLQSAERGAEENMVRLSDRAFLPVRMLQAGVSDSSHYAEDEVERQIQAMLERMGIPSRDRIERLSREIEQLSDRLDEELAHLQA